MRGYASRALSATGKISFNVINKIRLFIAVIDSKIRKMDYHHPKIKDFWPYYVILLSIFLIELPQIMAGHIILGTDTLYHYNRFYEDAMQILHQNWSYWISIYGFHHSARIVNAVYSPYLAYIMGAVLLICHTFYNFQIFTDFLVPIAAAYFLKCGFHIAGLYNKNNRWIMVIYALSYQVFHWNISTNFTSIGAVFIPLIIGCLIRMLKHRHTTGVVPLQLGLITALIVQVHLVTALQSLLLEIVVIPVAFLHKKGYIDSSNNTFVNVKWDFVKNVSEATLIGGLLCTNMLAGVWELFTNNNIASLQQLSFQQDRIFNYNDSINGSFMNTSILIIMLILIMTTLASDHWQTRFIGILSLLCFFVASPILPWRAMMKDFPPLGVIQYPSRFLVPAVSLACFFVAMTFSRNHGYFLQKWYLHAILIAFACFTVAAIVSNYHATSHYTQAVTFSNRNIVFHNPDNYSYEHNKRKVCELFSSDNLSAAMRFAYQGTGDYLPLNHRYHKNPYSKVYWNNLQNIYGYQGNGVIIKKLPGHSKIRLKIISDVNSTVNLPEVAYANTSADGSTVNTLPNKHSQDPVNIIKAPVHRGVNYINIAYHPNYADTALLIINVIAWVICLVVLLIGYIQFFIHIYRQNHEDSTPTEVVRLKEYTENGK